VLYSVHIVVLFYLPLYPSCLLSYPFSVAFPFFSHPRKQVQAECVEEVRAAVAMLTRNASMLSPVSAIYINIHTVHAVEVHQLNLELSAVRFS